MDAAADVLGAADASARTLSRLHALISAWAGAPEQVHHLRDDVERFSSLLESTRQAGGPVSAAAGAAAAARPVDDDPVLVREVALARRALEAVEAVLADLLSGEAKGGAGGSASGSSAEAARSADAKRRHRWVLRREEVARSQRGLQLSCQQMLSRLVMLNLSVTTDVAATVQRHEQLLKDIHKFLTGPEDKVDGATSETLLGQNRQRALNNSRDDGHSPGDILRAGSAPGQTEVRDPHNEQRFQHLEQVFSSITRGADAGRGTADHPRGRPGSLSQCEGFCRCKCHRHPRKFRDYRLLAFTKSLGAFSFSFWSLFGTACDLETCLSPRSKWVKATYTFPAWLFHATVSVFSSCVASPELVLRVCRRIPNDNATLYDGTLYGYVTRGDIDSVRRLLLRKEAAVTDVKDYGGETILHTAFNFMDRLGDLSMIRLLVQEGADWFQSKDNGHLPWIYAFQYIFSDPNASESSRDELASLVPLDLMIESAKLSDLHKIVLGIHHIDIREFLRLRSDDVNVFDIAGYTPLGYAAARGDEDTLQALLDAGAEPEFPQGLPTAKALHLACQTVKPKIVKRLLRAGADVHVKSWLQRTPLIWLARSQVKRCQDGSYASESDLLTIAHDLVQAGAEISHEDQEQWSAINFAAAFNHVALIEYLLALGDDVDHRDQEGSTPLMTAIAFDAREAAAALLRRGADCRAVDRKGLNVLHCLARFASAEMMASFVWMAEAGAGGGGGGGGGGGPDGSTAAAAAAAALAGINITRENDEGLTPLRALERRPDASAEMRGYFERLLDLSSRPTDSALPGARVDGQAEEDEEDEEDEFYDAVDTH